MMGWVQYIFDGFKAAIPRQKSTTYGLRFLWQLTPVAVLATVYYTDMDFLEENDPYFMQVYDLRSVEMAKEQPTL
jgi:hypothetical protein